MNERYNTRNKLVHLDSFKFLGKAVSQVTQLSSKVTNLLNRVLPSRILSTANIFNTSIDVAQDLSKMVMLHVEDSLIEQNVLIAQKELSVRGLATLSGHYPTRPVSSSGIIRIQINQLSSSISPSIIFNKTEFVCNENNLKYMMVEDTQNFAISTENIYLKVIEGTFILDSYVAEGIQLETINLDSVYPIEESHIKVYVNGEIWLKADGLYDMKAGQKSFLLKPGITNQVDIIFGNGIYGKKLNSGDSIQVEYLNTSGELGNLDENSTFKITTGIFDVNGNAVDINETSSITVESGFNLGSNGEDIEITRLITGFNSRAMVFSRPENLKAYLSRLSILSYIEAWSDLNSNVFHLLLAPNISRKIISYTDYLNLPLSSLVLSDDEKDSILEYINSSGYQSTSSEIVIHDPKFTKYIVFCYISGQIADKLALKNAIQAAISKEFLDKTLLNTINVDNEYITINGLENAILKETGLTECTINMISEKNELSRINKKYIKIQEHSPTIVGSSLARQSKSINVSKDINLNIGFNDLGSIVVDGVQEIPIIRGGFRKYSSDNNHVFLEKPIYIFHKTNNGFEEL